MSERDRFLSRWSRRKHEVRLQSQRGGGPAGAVPEGPVAPDAPARSEEAIARLPRLDELTAESDVTLFLRAGVPEPLRNAALRRAWALDPKIRDYVSEAREYAYDWNRPGDLPGNGPLPRDFDVKALVGRLFREPGPADPADPVAAPQPTTPPPDSGARGRLPPHSPAMATSVPAPPIDSGPGAGGVAPAAVAPGPLRKRRHGGAVPI